MEELLQAPTEGYGEAIVITEINADHFKIKTNLLQLVQANLYHGFERENPHTHINNFKMITLTLKFRDVPKDVIKLMMFSYSLEGNARVWYDKEPLNSILTWEDFNQSSTSSTLSSNTIQNPKGEMKAITTRSGVAYEGPSIPTPKRVVEQETDETTDKEQTNFQGSTALIQPSRCSSKNLLEKLGDPGKFLIPCDFSRMDVCPALADLGASINLMPCFIWKKLSLPELTPTRMTLELADQSITHPKGVTEDVFVKVGKFHFPTDFVVVDFKADPRVPLILGRSFLRTVRDLIYVCGEEITLQFNDKAITFNLNQTTRYSSTYDDLSVNRIDIIDVAREEYAQAILGFSNNYLGSNPTSTSEPILSDASHSLTPFEGSNFILEEIKAYLKDESSLPEIDHADCDRERDICLIEKLLNDDPFQLLLMDLKQGEVVKAKYSIEEPPELKLKDLPSHLEYAYLEALKYLLSKQDVKPRLIRWVVLLQEFDIIIHDKKGTENLAADHLSIVENPHKDVFENNNINENFPLETLGMSSQQKKKFFKDVKHYFWDDPYLFHIYFMGPFPSSQGNRYILVVVDYLSKWVEMKVLPTNDARVVLKFLKFIFARFKTSRAIISHRGIHFCNDKFAKVMSNYGVTHRLATSYHPQTSGQVKVSNWGLKRILKRTVGENRASWSEKLDVALWAFRTAYKIPIVGTPNKLVYGKSCHLPTELEHKAYWALKHVNFNLKTTGGHRKLQLNELNELRDQAYDNSLIYKEKTKKIHDSKIKTRIFNVGDRVLLFNYRLKIFSRKLKTH
nr:reverse transcriptase domain-containing protein [Tanacetum cinerariifolium]